MSKVAYIVKRYPRFSETFIVNELLAHQQAGLDTEIFSLRPPVDTHFQDLISQVHAPLTYLSRGCVKANELWGMLQMAQAQFPKIVKNLGKVVDQDVLDVYCGLKLAVATLQREITHLHAHFASSAASVARIASILTDIPYSMTAHAKDIFHDSVDCQDLEKKISDSTVTFTVSDYNLQYLQRRFAHVHVSKIVRLYNGMHLSHFPYHSPDHRQPRIIAVGRFVEKKGFLVLVEACRILRDRKASFHCSLVGDGELLPEIQARIQSHRLEDQVQLLGPQPQRVVKQLIAESAVLAVPCINGSDGNRDGLPTVLLEAMSLGTPCVGTDVTGIPEVIVPDVTGLQVPQNSPAELANAIALLLSDGQLRCRLASEARRLLTREFDITVNSAIQRDYFCHGSRQVKQPAMVAPCLAEV